MRSGRRTEVVRKPARRRALRRRLPINVRLALSSGWSIYAHHGTSNDDGYRGLRYEHWERAGHGEARRHEYEARYREIPEDTRDLTGRILGDPLPGRSALAKKHNP
jgi:hypothetical protein